MPPAHSPVAPLSGGQAIVESLIRERIDTIFALPGAQMYPLFDALHERRKQLRTVVPRHEQGCGYMAFGYAQATGRPSVFSVVPGPGVLNAGAALATAWGCNTPVLCITSEIPSAFIGKRRGHLHELPDQLGTLRKLVKWAERAERVADIPLLIHDAFRHMLSGRPGPAALEVPWDVMMAKEPVALHEATVAPTPHPPDARAIAAAAELISEARSPIIFVGSGARHAGPEVCALAEFLGAPVAALRGGRGVVSEEHPLGVSAYGAKLLWPEADVCVGIGSRLEMPYIRWAGQFRELVDAPTGPPQLVRIDIDPVEMYRLRPHRAIVGDAAVTTRALLSELRKSRRRAAPANANIPFVKERACAEAERDLAPYSTYLQAIRHAVPRDAILVDEVTQAGFASQVVYPVFAPRTYITAGFQGTLGFGFPTAIGVQIAMPDRTVVSITGDGGFMFGVQELATAARERVPLIIVLFNNNGFGNVVRDQERIYGRNLGGDLHNPDFLALAASFGIAGERVRTPEALGRCLSRHIASGRPVLIEVKVNKEPEISPWAFLL